MASLLDHRRVSPVGGESQPASTSIWAQRLPSFENHPLPCHHADRPKPGERCEPRGSRAGGGADWPDWPPEVISSPVVPVLSFLTGLQVALTPLCLCPSPRPTASGDGLICPKDGFALTASA